MLEERVKTRARLGLGPAGEKDGAPLMGRMATRAQYEENERVNANVDWRKVCKVVGRGRVAASVALPDSPPLWS